MTCRLVGIVQRSEGRCIQEIQLRESAARTGVAAELKR